MNIPSILLLLICSKNAFTEYHLKENSLYPPYLSNDWTSYGNTVIDPQFVRLTSDAKSNKGGIFNKVPLITRDWEVHIMFHVHGEGTNLFGDGFAFWYTQTPPSLGPCFGSRDIFRGLGIFFDTYANQNGAHSHDHPYISAMINDGSKRYDHDKDGTLTELAGCSSQFRSKEYTKAIIRYTNQRLTVFIKFEDVAEPTECFSIGGVKLPTGYYIGVSAATGDLSDNHDIHSIHVMKLDVTSVDDNIFIDHSKIEPSAEHEAPGRERHDDTESSSSPGRTFLKLFFWLFLLGIIGVSVYMGYKFYLKRQRQVKRFY